MIDFGELAVVGIGDVLLLGEEVPDAVDELLCAHHAGGAPGLGHLQRPHEHLVQPQGIRAVFPHYVAGIHHEFREALAHLDAVLAQNHALMHQLLERLLHGRQPLIVQEAVPDP